MAEILIPEEDKDLYSNTRCSETGFPIEADFCTTCVKRDNCKGFVTVNG